MDASVVRRLAKAIIPVFVFSMLFSAAYSPAAAAAVAADIVLGQVDYTSSGANIVKPAGVDNPGQVAFDTTTARVYVCDSNNNRVLWWNNSAALANGQAADGVLGQANLTATGRGCSETLMDLPTGVAVDGAGNVWVADQNNDRVIRFSAPITTGKAASLVLAQPDFTTNTNSSSDFSETTLHMPQAVALDAAGNLWVSDYGHGRAVRFDAPFSINKPASIVIGKADFADYTYSLTPVKICNPGQLYVDSGGNLWVTDPSYNRVCKYSVPISSGMAASVVLGQADFASDGGDCTATQMSGPYGVSVDGAGNVYVADNYNSRVLRFNAPVSSGAPAALVLGQTLLTTSDSACSDSALSYPGSLTLDCSGNLWVTDTSNNRILKFTTPLTTGKAASLVLGQEGYTQQAPNMVSSRGVKTPTDVVEGPAGRLYVCDTSNNRVLWWNNADDLAAGSPADGMLGQPNMAGSAFACTATGLNGPCGLSVDNAGNVWVADTNNNRVLKYVAPVTPGKEASLVLGQGDFTSSGSDCTAWGLSGPSGISVDGAGNVWVADTYNDRVLKFSAPLTNGATATLVLGKANFISFGGTGPTILNRPRGVSIDDAGSVWVADSSNNRVVKYAVPLSSGMAATFVLGQQNLTSCGYAATAKGMNSPNKIAIDAAGNAWVADNGNNRVLKYAVPLSSGMAATSVLGQPDFTTSDRTVSATGMESPSAAWPTSAGNLWVSDTDNNRLLCFRRVAAPRQQPETRSGRVDLSTGAVLSIRPDSGEIRVAFPAGTFAQAVNVSVSTSAVPSPRTPTVKVGKICLEISNDLGLQPDKDITITIAYRDSDIDGLEASKLVLCRYDGATGSWVRLPTTVDTVNRTITATVRHLSTFVVTQVIAAGDLAQARAYPVPYAPAQGVMTFDRLTAGATLKIFNVAGEAIRSLTASDAGIAVWDGKNDGGSPVASGVYLVFINSPQGKKTVKIAVER